MHLGFTPRELELQSKAREFARSALLPTAREREAQHDIPHAIITQLGALGLLSVNVPAHLGGSEAGSVAYALALREIAAGDASVAVTMAVTNMVAEVICKFGTDAQQQAHVPRLASGEYFGGAFALSEPNAGSDAASLTTRATPEVRDGQAGFVIRGAKLWISTGDRAGVVVVWARTGGPGAKGISAFLVDGGTPGMTAGRPEDKMGLLASHTVPLSFDDVWVPESALLSGEGQGFPIAMTALDGGRIGIGSQAMGIAQAALDEARKHLRQDAKAAARAQERLADMATEMDAAWLLTLRAARLKGRGDVRFSREAAMAKVMASETANRVVRSALHLLGSSGYMEQQSAAARLVRDCRVSQIYEGTSEVQRLVIGREVLREMQAR